MSAQPAATRDDAKQVTIFENRIVTVHVPAKWRMDEVREPTTGVQTVELADPDATVNLQLSFFPDSEGKLTSRENLEAKMRQVFAPYLRQSVEQDMKITVESTRDGIMGFTSFTDRSLIGKPIPKGEHLISTTGIRSWKGAYLLFTLLSDSPEVETRTTAMDVVRHGLDQTAGPKPD